MSDRAAISVIIPVYNGEPWLRKCLDSVFAQTLQSVQVICVNDGSTDGSAEILAAYQTQHPEMIVLAQENAGQSCARNAGLACAQGEYLHFLDCDDAIRPETYEHLYARASRDALDLLLFDAEVVFSNEAFQQTHAALTQVYSTKVTVPDCIPGQELFVRLVEGKSYRVSPCLYLARLDFFRASHISFVPGVIYEDNVFTLEAQLLAERASVDPTPYYLRLVRDGSTITRKKTFYDVRSYYICKQAIEGFLVTRSFPESVLRCAKVQTDTLMGQAVKAWNMLSPRERDAAAAQAPGALLIECAIRKWEQPSQRAQDKQADPFGGAPWVREAATRLYTEQPYNPDVPLVSVIFPVYNAEAHLREAVEDLQGQTLRNFEMLFVDDGSTDRSKDILLALAKKDARIHVFHQKNQHAGAARNTGMDNARGKYLLFLDADDRFSPNLLVYACACAESNEAEIVIFHADLLQMPEEALTPAAFLCPCRLLPDCVFSAREGSTHLFAVLNPWLHFYRRNYIEQLGIRYQTLYSCNDLYFSMVAKACAQRIAPLPVVLVHYRTGQTGNIQSLKSMAPLDIYHAFSGVKKELETRGIYEDFQRPFAAKAAESVIRTLDSMKSLEAYRALYAALHDGGLEELDILSAKEEDMQAIFLYDDILERCRAIRSLTFDEYLLWMLTRKPCAAALPHTLYGEEVTRLRGEVQALRGSWAYRIGSKLTLIPHHVKKLFKRK